MSQRAPLDSLSLAQFTGSEEFYRHTLVGDVLYTEGAKYVADTAQAYWLIDHIALAQRYEHAVKVEESGSPSIPYKGSTNCCHGTGRGPGAS